MAARNSALLLLLWPALASAHELESRIELSATQVVIEDGLSESDARMALEQSGGGPALGQLLEQRLHQRVWLAVDGVPLQGDAEHAADGRWVRWRAPLAPGPHLVIIVVPRDRRGFAVGARQVVPGAPLWL